MSEFQDTFDLELSDDDNSVEIESPIADGLGISDIDDLELDISIEGDGDGLELDLSAEEESLSDSVLFKSGVDVVKTLVPYLHLVREAVTLTAEKDITRGSQAFAVDSAEFDYMPDDVFRVFNGILIDMATGDNWRVKTVEACAEQSLVELHNVTQWSPMLNKPEYIEGFIRWCNRFRRLADTKSNQKRDGLLSVVDVTALKEAEEFFSVNTVAFNVISNVLADATIVVDGVIDPGELGSLAQSFMASTGSRSFTLQNAYDCILGYLGSDELREALRLSQDEVLEYSPGELIRRLLVYELTSGVIYPFGIKDRPSNDAPAIVKFLGEAIASGSVACDLIQMTAHLILTYEQRKRGGSAPQTYELLSSLLQFFQAYIKDDTFINPTFYGCVTRGDDGGLCLSYADGDETVVVPSSDILCDIVGNKTKTFCIPKILRDKSRGYMVCPPAQLVTPLRSMAVSGRIKVSGDILFKFTPTLSWLEANKILAQDEVVEGEEKRTGIALADTPLLVTLMNYRGSFSDAGFQVLPVVVVANGYVLYSVSKKNSAESLSIYLAEKAGSSADDRTPVSRHGTMVLDSETGNLIVSLDLLSGGTDEFVVSQGQFSEEFLGSAVDIAGDEGAGDMCDVLLTAVQSQPVEYLEYRNATKSLCELAALSYTEELNSVQEVIARDLFNVVYVPAIDELVSCRILQAYKVFTERNKEAGKEKLIDDFNWPSFSELVDIVDGSKNPFRGSKEWDADVAKAYSSWVSSRIDVDSVCRSLDTLDFDVLALQVLSRSEVGRQQPDMLAYRALLGIKEIGSRLAVLEDKMVTLRVLDLLGDQVLSVFSKRSYICKAYQAQVTKDNIDSVHNVLVEKSKRKDVGYTLPLSKKVLSNAGTADDVVLKYFVLERNVYGLLDVVYSNPETYEGKYIKFLEDLGLSEVLDIKGVSSTEFSKMVSVRDAAEFISGANKPFMDDVVYKGLLCEALSSNHFQVVKAYDLFTTFYDLLVGTGDNVAEHNYLADLFSYAGSLVVSYCPVVDIASSKIDGGSSRAMEFVSSPEDFVYDTPVEYLAKYDIQDVRLTVEGQ